MGRTFYQKSSQDIVQGIVDRNDVAVATDIFFVTMTVEGAFWNILPHHLSQELPKNPQANATISDLAYSFTIPN